MLEAGDLLAIIERGRWDKAQELLITKKWSSHHAKIKNMPNKFVVARVKSGRLRGFYLIDPAWNNEERNKFINILKSLNESEDSQ